MNQTFTESRTKWCVGAFCVLSAWLYLLFGPGSDAPHKLKGFIAVYIGCPISLSYFIYGIARPPKLVVKPEGFSVTDIIERTIGWHETSDFIYKKPFIGKGLVKFQQYSQSGVWRKTNLFYNFGHQPKGLAKILNTYRNQALRLRQDFPA